MLVSRKLLERYVNLDGISTEEIADRLTNAGLEVEGISTIIQGTQLVVGHVLECVPHPDSDHLHVTQVNVGSHVEQIVCGAANIAKDQYVVVALVGAELPGLSIKETSIRGVESRGMICSLNELGVAEKYQTEEQKEGIVVLEPAEPGSNPAVALGMDDEILDVSQTPNRSDFLSMFAVAKEVGAIFERSVSLPTLDGTEDEGSKTSLTTGSETEKATSFYGKVVNKVTIKQSPLWIREVLIASGIKPINNVVDISNLVMLETGQPLHYYDIDFLANQSLTVKDDVEGTYLALDEKEYTLQKGDLVIMNGDTPVGIAGIMGLGNSMITDNTRGIIIEAARFNNVSVRKTSTRLGIFSESSARFTKPMDPLGLELAIARSVQLLKEYADADGLEETVKYGVIDFKAPQVSVGLKRVNDYLGTTLSLETLVNVFERLNFEPTVNGDEITCTIPSYRRDIELDVDLIEEVIRIVGYDVLEETLPLLDLTMGTLTPLQRTIRLIESVLLGFGANQINSYTLVEESFTKGFMALGEPVSLMSPMSDKRAFIRNQLYPSMLETLAYNNSHKIQDGLYFEHSRIYSKEKNSTRLALIGQGVVGQENWTKAAVKLDFYTLKGMVLSLLDKLGYQSKRIGFTTKDLDTHVMHPFKSAVITLDRQVIGTLGHLHPTVVASNDLSDAVYCEIDLDALLSRKSGQIKATAISKYPVVTRDLSILCDKDVVVQDLIQLIEKGSKRYLVGLNVFDVFESEKLGDKKSIALELSFGQNRTLEVEEINDIMNQIETLLVEKLNVEIR